MKNRGILGILIVIAMVMTAVPVLSGEAKATGSNSNYVPSYLIIVRDIPNPNPRIIDKTIGNAYQSDKFGVEIVVHVDHYMFREQERTNLTVLF